MSCEGNRARYLAVVAAEPAVVAALGDAAHAQTILLTLYDTACQRQDSAPALADALTRLLFGWLRAQGLTPPTHAADGLPKPAARQGYAAIAQTLLAIRSGRALPALAAQIAQATPERPIVASAILDSTPVLAELRDPLWGARDVPHAAERAAGRPAVCRAGGPA